VDEIKNDIQKMVWTCDADGRRENTEENATDNNRRKMIKMDRPDYKGNFSVIVNPHPWK
jgi:hypothetical protein